MKSMTILGLSIIAVACIGLAIDSWLHNKPCNHMYINATDDDRFIIIPQDSCDGKPTFTVVFDDDFTIEHMFAEEIMVGLAKGEWKYNDFLGEDGHVCYDKTHVNCDGQCECDGLMCSTKRGI